MTKNDFISRLIMRFPTLSSDGKSKPIKLQDIDELISCYDESSTGKLWDWFYNTYDKSQPPSRATFYNAAQIMGIRATVRPNTAAQQWWLFKCAAPSKKNPAMKCGYFQPLSPEALPLTGSPERHRCPGCGRNIVGLPFDAAMFTDGPPDFQRLNRYRDDKAPTEPLKYEYKEKVTAP
jgi:hypothetical protein